MKAIGLIEPLCKMAQRLMRPKPHGPSYLFAVIRSDGVERHASPPQADYEF